MKRGHVTIIDDDRDHRQMLRMAFEAEGVEVGEVQSGLRLISTLHVDRPDVILMEASLSWVDGIELCRSIKKNPAFRDVPIIFISVKRRSEDIVAGLRAGAVDYFPKPIHLARLIPRVREILALQSPEGSPPSDQGEAERAEGETAAVAARDETEETKE